MRNLTHRWPQSGHFFPKLGYFFPNFEKGQGRPSPLSPLVTRLVNTITDNKVFWKKIQPIFSEKSKFANKIIFEDNEQNNVVSQELNNFFQNATKTVNINENSYTVDLSSSITDPVDKAINTNKKHPSILLIKQKLENVDHFSF